MGLDNYKNQIYTFNFSNYNNFNLIKILDINNE